MTHDLKLTAVGSSGEHKEHGVSTRG